MADNDTIPILTPRPKPQAQDTVGRFFDYDPKRYQIAFRQFFFP